MFNNVFQIPPLPERRDLIIKFSTFLVVENNGNKSFIKWQQDGRLKQFIEKRIKPIIQSHNPRNNHEDFMINYCVDRVKILKEIKQPEPYLELLKAYLQESCYWAVIEVLSEQKNVGETWHKAMDLSTFIIQQQAEIFIRKYEQKHSSQAKLETFVKAILKTSIKSELKLVSKWRLLFGKDTSKNTIKSSLLSIAIPSSEINIYLYAWGYCKEVYLNNNINIPTRKKGSTWPNPELSDFEETAKYCLANKNQPYAPWEIANYETITAKQIENWMNICIDALQKLSKKFDNNIQNYSELLDSSRDKINQNNLDQFSEVLLNKQHNLKLINNYIIKLNNNEVTFKKVKEKDSLKLVAILKYGLKLNQDFLAKTMFCNQATISRKLNENYQQPLASFLIQNIASKERLYCNCFLIISQKKLDDVYNIQLNQIIKSFIQDSEIKTCLNLSEKDSTTLHITQIFWGKSFFLKIKNFDIIEKRVEFYKTQIYEIIESWFKEQIQNIAIYLLENHFYQSNVLPILSSNYLQLLKQKQSKDFQQNTVIDEKDYLINSLLQWFKNNENILLESQNKNLDSVVEKFLKTSVK